MPSQVRPEYMVIDMAIFLGTPEPGQVISIQANMKKKMKAGQVSQPIGTERLRLKSAPPVSLRVSASAHAKMAFHGLIRAQKLPSSEQMNASPTQAITQTMTTERFSYGLATPKNPAATVSPNQATNNTLTSPNRMGCANMRPMGLPSRLTVG